MYLLSPTAPYHTSHATTPSPQSPPTSVSSHMRWPSNSTAGNPSLSLIIAPMTLSFWCSCSFPVYSKVTPFDVIRVRQQSQMRASKPNTAWVNNTPLSAVGRGSRWGFYFLPSESGPRAQSQKKEFSDRRHWGGGYPMLLSCVLTAVSPCRPQGFR
jgi:hypothetical protein